MILELSDITEFLKKCDSADIVDIILISTKDSNQDAEIAELLADYCRKNLKRYKLIK